MTPEQERALALARARKRRAGAEEQARPSTLGDMAQSGLTGIRQGLEGLAGMMGDAQAATGGASAWLAGKLGASPDMAETIGSVMRRVSPVPFAPTTQEIQGNLTTPVVGEHYDPQTTAGEYTRTIGQFLPAAAAGPGSLPQRLVTQALIPALGSETAGQFTEGTAAEPYARIAGALAGAAVPSVLSRAISPMRIDPARRQAAEVLKQEGIRPTAGQVSGNRSLRYAESEIGGGRAAQLMDDQAEAFTSAAMRRIGESGRASPEALRSAKDRLSQGFDTVSARNAVRVDQGFVDDLNATMKEYMRVLPTEQKKIVRNIAQDIVDRFKEGSGSISGRDYQNFRSRLTKRVQNARGKDDELMQAWRGLRDALDNAMTRSVRPEDAAEWADLRRQWGNMRTLERAAVGGGEDAALGLISPARLRMAASTGNRGGYARGEGDFSELARAGQALLTPLPNSGTAARTAARNLGAGILAGGGALAGGPLGMIAGLLAPPVAGKALMSKPVQAYLMNQVAGSPDEALALRSAIAALLAGQQNRPAIAP